MTVLRSVGSAYVARTISKMVTFRIITRRTNYLREIEWCYRINYSGEVLDDVTRSIQLRDNYTGRPAHNFRTLYPCAPVIHSHP
jgi:hypothetical protein